MRGSKNCIRCTRWRPLTDYKHTRFGNPGGICRHCIKERERKRRGDPEVKELERINKKAARELKGVTPRLYTGIKGKSNEARRRRAERTRRNKGVKPRKIGPLNKGKYGLQTNAARLRRWRKKQQEQ